MKLLFVYSAKFKKDNEGNLYTDGSINETLWKRYTDIADEVEIISRLEPYEHAREYAIEKFNQFDTTNKSLVEVPDLFSSITSYVNYAKRAEFKRIIKQKVIENDYIIVRVPSTEGYLAIKYAKQYNKPYLVEVVGCPKDALWNHSFKGKILAYPNYLAMKKAVKDSPYALYVTNQFLQERYPSTGKNIGCSDVILTQSENDVLYKRLLKIQNLEETSPIILGTTAAVNVRYKGQEYVIQAIGKLKKAGYNFEYHLAGGGDNSYLKEIAEKSGVSNEVKFLGTLPHDEVFSYLDSIDIYIQPSLLEGLPRALVEAMSRACPAIGTRVGGIPELLQVDSLFAKGAVDEICELLKQVDSATLIKHAERNFNKAKEYDMDVLEERRKSFYKEFVSSGSQKI